MNEILSLIKPKERIIIAAALAAFAVILTTVICVVSFSTAEDHVHRYEYHTEVAADGEIDLIAFCIDAECKDPHFVKNVTEEVTERIVTEPTCCAEGTVEYSYYNDADKKTYTCTDDIVRLPHTYVGDKTVNDDGSVSINALCTNDGCTSPELTITSADELKLDSVVDATCYTPKSEHYSFSQNGVSGNVTIYADEDVDHKLGGVFITEYELSDGVYKYGTEGMHLSNDVLLNCGESGKGYFVCEVCDETVSVTLGKADHSYVYIESETVRPTTEKDGSAVVKCINGDGCTESKTIVLPAAAEGVNSTVVSIDHLAQTKTLKYSFVSDEHSFSVEFEYDVEWVEHVYAFVLADSTAPSLTDLGKAVIKCTIDGCSESHKVDLPAITLSGDGKNSEVISSATETKLETVKYIYKIAEYGVTVEMTLEVGEYLTHNYVYAIELVDDAYVLVGRCDQPDCQTPVVYDEAEVKLETIPATCVSYAENIYTCQKDGVTYTKTVVLEDLGYSTHDYKYAKDETALPTLTDTGLAYVRCTREGCDSFVEITLPAVGGGYVEIDENHDTEIITYSYKYVSDDYGFTVEHTVTEDVVHTYAFFENESKLPTVTDGGEAVIRCTFEGCTKSFTEILPGIIVSGEGKNSDVIVNVSCMAREKVKYTYVIDKFEIKIELAIEIGETLPHNYIYQLEPIDSTFVLVGRCDYPGCDAKDVCSDIEVKLESVPATCVSYARDVWSCEKDGVRYEQSVILDFLPYGPHNLVYSAGDTVYPDFVKTGLAYVRCSHGCGEFVEIILPNMAGEYMKIEDDLYNGIRSFKYSYTNEEYNFTVNHKIDVEIEHAHDYKYKLIRKDGEFVLEAVCQRDVCKFNRTIYVDVIVTEIHNTTTCTALGTITYACVFNNNGVDEVYSYSEPDTELLPHEYVIVDSEIVEPTRASEGIGVIRCSACGDTVETTLPVIEDGVNFEIYVENNDGVEIKVFKYTHYFEEYDITFEIYERDLLPHTHAYVYTLYREDGKFYLKGICEKDDFRCDPRIVVIEVEPTFVGDTSTCVAQGKLVWSYEASDGNTYTYEEDSDAVIPHNYQYVNQENTKPAEDKGGTGILKCTQDGCSSIHIVDLPKLEVGVNAVLNRVEFEEMQVYDYTYYCEEFDYTFSFEVYIFLPHVHDYAYELVKENGVFIIKGICEKPIPTCEDRQIAFEVTPTFVGNTSTCVELGTLVWVYTIDDQDYLYKESATELASHKYTIVDSDRLEAPSFTREGSAYLMCEICGDHSNRKIILPMAAAGVNAEIISTNDTTGIQKLRYRYTDDISGVTIELVVQRLINHTHTCDTYELIPASNLGIGKFNLEGVCNNPECRENVCYEDVAVILVSNTSTCTTAGRQIWHHERDGVIYECKTNLPIFADHEYSYDADAITTVLPGVDSKGSIELSCGSCNRKIVVTLPEISAENSVIVSESATEIVYNYTLDTNGVSVELKITVSK